MRLGGGFRSNFPYKAGLLPGGSQQLPVQGGGQAAIVVGNTAESHEAKPLASSFLGAFIIRRRYIY